MCLSNGGKLCSLWFMNSVYCYIIPLFLNPFIWCAHFGKNCVCIWAACKAVHLIDFPRSFYMVRALWQKLCMHLGNMQSCTPDRFSSILSYGARTLAKIVYAFGQHAMLYTWSIFLDPFIWCAHFGKNCVCIWATCKAVHRTKNSKYTTNLSAILTVYLSTHQLHYKTHW